MPFTAAHPLAVLPLLGAGRTDAAGRGARGWRRAVPLDATCLVIGSMAPDFEYFVRGRSVQTISHSLVGLVVWNLPVTLVVAALVHALVKWPLLVAAPEAVARRAITVVGGPWRARWTAGALAWCAISAVIGAASHLVWDGFTHADVFGPQLFPILRASIDLPALGPMVVHRVLQHASTVLGLVVLSVVAIRAVRRAAPVALPALPRAWARSCLAVCVAAGLVAMYARLAIGAASGASPPWPPELGLAVIAGIDGVLAGVLVASAILYRAGRRLAAAVAPPRR